MNDKSKKYIEKVAVSIGCAGLCALGWHTVGSWLPFMHTLPTGLGFTGVGVALGVFASDEIIASISKAGTKIKEVAHMAQRFDPYDEDKYDDDDDYVIEETLSEIADAEEHRQKDINEYDFFLREEYYIDIMKWYKKQGYFDEARKTYCSSRGIDYTPLDSLKFDIEFLEDTLLTIVDACSDRFIEESRDDADIVCMINEMGYKLVYNAGYYAVVNGRSIVDDRCIINSIARWSSGMSFEEKLHVVNTLCERTGVTNPITKQTPKIENGNIVKLNFKR